MPKLLRNFVVTQVPTESDDILSITVEISPVQTLDAPLPREVSSKLTEILSLWVESEKKLMKLLPTELQHYNCCTCGFCSVTPPVLPIGDAGLTVSYTDI